MLQSDQVFLRDLLGGPESLALPTYQRDYTWERQHIEALVDDIEHAIELYGPLAAHAKYFLGNIILCRDGTSDAPPRTFIIDGQQRIISLTLIAAALRDFLKSDALIEKLDALIRTMDVTGGTMRLDLRSEDDDKLLKTYVQKRGGMLARLPAAVAIKSETAQALLENRTLVLKRIQSMTARDRTIFAEFLLSNCVVIVTRTDDVDTAFQIYLTLNNRGKRLATEDILHGELIGPLADTERQKYADILDSFSKYRRNLRVVTKSNSKTFFSHLVGTIGGGLDEVIKPIRKAMAAAGGAHQFAESVFRPMADAYRIVMPRSTERATLSPRAQTALTNLDWFEAHANDDYIPAAMLAVSLLPHGGDALADLLEKIDWVAHTLAAAGVGRKPRREAYDKVAKGLREFRAGTLSLNALLALQPLTQSTVNKAVVNVGRKLMETDKAFCRLVLVRIDALLSQRPLSAYAQYLELNPQDATALTVEHIVPKGNSIKAEYVAEWQAFSDNRSRLAIAQHLGNLALLARSENTDCDQKGFPKKQIVLFGSDRKRTHFIATTQELSSLADFTEIELLDRHQRMQKATEAIWGWSTSSNKVPVAVAASVPAPTPQTGKARKGKGKSK